MSHPKGDILFDFLYSSKVKLKKKVGEKIDLNKSMILTRNLKTTYEIFTQKQKSFICNKCPILDIMLLILAFDLKGKSWAKRKRIYRSLQQIGAKLVYTSHWVLPYNKRNLADMKCICNEIRKYGGKAEVVKGEKIV